ncbi:MAG TPA: DegT/DnrJ/EryC1/StrS family aminotransferase [Solirubrobacteraceae bacterium]|nr:DegT/DnrJ/EryC1/StrS family aminotransferase [Solirubrobacteraceae bacterium]
MSWEIPLADLVLTDEDIGAVLDVLSGGWVTMGPRTQRFEAAFAELLGVPHAVALSSGTAALHLSLLGAGIGEGDEVLVSAMTFVAAAAAIRYCGATPVFVESVGPDDLNLDPDDVARQIGPRTRAIIATHWMGYSCDLPALERLCDQHGLLLIEDAAQSITAMCADGRLTGTVGIAGCFSFFSKKQLSVGEGGMLVTPDVDVAAKVRSLRSHAMTSVTWDRHRGYAESYDVVDVGFNLRIDEARAALGLSRMARLHDDIARRRSLVRHYRERLADHPAVTFPWSDDEVERGSHFGFPVIFEAREERDRVVRELEDRHIQTTWYPSLTDLSAYSHHPSRPITEDLAGRHLLLPLSSTFSEDQLEIVISQLTEILAAGPSRTG